MSRVGCVCLEVRSVSRVHAVGVHGVTPVRVVSCCTPITVTDVVVLCQWRLKGVRGLIALRGNVPLGNELGAKHRVSVTRSRTLWCSEGAGGSGNEPPIPGGAIVFSTVHYKSPSAHLWA